MTSETSYTKAGVDSKLTTKADFPAGGSDGQVLVKSGTTTAWTTINASSGVTDATTTSKGVVQLAGDLTGTATSPALKAVLGAAGTIGTATQIPVISYDTKGRITAVSTVAVTLGSTPDATATSKGVIELAGDLAGTAAAPTVAKVNGIPITGTPTTSTFLRGDGAWASPAGSGGIGTNVKTVGAVGDGVTNNTTAIQNAINGGGPIYFPRGTYLITSTLAYTNVNRFYGDGILASIIHYTGTAGTFAFSHTFTTDGSGEWPGRVAWDDLTIQGDGTNSSSLGTDATVGGINCSDSSTNLINIPFYSLRRVRIMNCSVGVQLEGYGHYFEECHIRYSAVGVDLTHPEQAALVGCWLEYDDVALRVNVRKTGKYGHNFKVFGGSVQRNRIGMQLRNFYDIEVRTYFELNNEVDVQFGDPADPTNYTSGVKNALIDGTFSGSAPTTANIDAYATTFTKIVFNNSGGTSMTAPHVQTNGYCKDWEVEYGDSSITSTAAAPFSFGGNSILTSWAHPRAGFETVTPTLAAITGLTASTTDPLRYYKTAGHEVVIDGAFTTDTTYTSGSTIFTLPVGYRPLYQKTFLVSMYAGAWTTSTIQVNTNGTVVWNAGTGTSRNVYLDGLRFRVGQTAY